jgi:hypothetical protein
MKTIQQLQAAECHRYLRSKIGEQLRAMYAEDPGDKPSVRLLNLLKDFEKIETGRECRKRD